MKKAAFFILFFLLILNNLSSQEVIIGKKEFPVFDVDIPIRTVAGDDFNYNQMIYKQPWLHAAGEIEKIAFYYGGASATFDIVVYMGHTQKEAFVNNEEWIPIEDLTLVFDGQYIVPDTTGWAEIVLQIPFDYNNTDNLVIAIDRNSELTASGNFYSTIIDDEKVTRWSYSEYYNIDPVNPINYGQARIVNSTPILKISGSLSLTDHLYIYGSKQIDITTTPGSQDSLLIETNQTSFSGSSNQEWLVVNTNPLNKKITVTVDAESSTLDIIKRESEVVVSDGTFSDTAWFTQYEFEPTLLDIAWPLFSFCDYDEDLDLDIVGTYPLFNKNDGSGNFTSMELDSDFQGKSNWADFDNDGDLDFLLLASDYHVYEDYYSKILRNDDTAFSVINSDLVPIKDFVSSWSYCPNPWCDFDNDGDKDLLLTGVDSLDNSTAILYTNLGNGKFDDSGINLNGSFYGSASWGDYNNDGYPDLIINGTDINGNLKTTLYKNNRAGGFIEIDNTISAIQISSIDWGDYDADGDLDILTSKFNNKNVLTIFTNDGNDIFTEITTCIDTIQAQVSRWIDLNNDGKLDIIAYTSEDFGKVFIYINKGADEFTEIITNIDAIHNSVLNIGNYDNDGDIDFLILGYYAPYTYKFRNNSNTINSKPTIPSGLNAIRQGTAMHLYWNSSTDNETAQKSLSYNVRIGSYPGGQDIMAPHADLSTGFITSPGFGNAFLDTFKIIDNLESGKYYWSVQSIDNIYTGSEFTAEQSFEMLPAFSRNDTIIPYLLRSSAVFGDYDNDGDFDLAICGTLSDASSAITKLYKNNSDSTFAEVSGDLIGIIDGTIAFGDYNNDNLLDLLVSGTNPSNTNKAYIYRNDGNDSFEVIDSFYLAEGDPYTHGSWGDYNNDGKLDVYLACGGTALLYQNLGDDEFILEKSFNDINLGLAAIADYDNDNDIDILLSGTGYPNVGTLFRNENSFQFTTVTDRFEGLHNGTGDPGDYDNDGDIDLLVTGNTELGYNFTSIYKNQSNDNFEEIITNIRSISEGQASWGDFDNDNDLDVVMGGYSGLPIIKVYENKGDDNFEEIFNHKPDDYHWNAEYVICGDYNNDYNLDFIKSGVLFSSNLNIEKTLLPLIQNLEVIIDGFNVTFSWDKIISEQAGDCYSYNLRLGTTPGGTEIVSPMADLETGFRKIQAIGNAQKNNAWIIKNLTPGETYYWSVQAIDNSYRGGAWAEEQSFVLNVVWADFIADTVCLGDTSHFTDISLYGENEINSWKWYFGDGDSAMVQHTDHLYSQSGSYSVTLIVSDGEFTGSITKNVIVKPKPIVDFQVNPVCYGNPSVFTNQTDEQGLTILSWNWEFDDNQTSNIKNPEPHYYAQAGEYNVKLTVTSDNGCFDTISKPVIVAQYPEVIVTANGPIEFCEGDNVLLSVAENANYLYQWKLDDVPISDSVNYHCNAIYKGAYTIDVENSLAGCLSNSLPVNVNVVEKPVIPIINTSGFDPDNCPESELITLEVTDATSLYQYQWKRNGIPLEDGVNSTYQDYLDEGNYIVDVANGDCKATSDEVPVFFNNELPEKPEIIAKGPNVWYLACTNDKAQQYEWYYNSEIITGANDYLYVANQTLGAYFVKIAEENGCFVASDAVTIPLSATGIDDVNPFAGLKIYPNPTPGMFTIEMNNQLYGELFIFIHTQEGKEVLNIKFYKDIQRFKTQIDLNGQGSGLYVILLSLDNYKTERKLIIE